MVEHGGGGAGRGGGQVNIKAGSPALQCRVELIKGA